MYSKSFLLLGVLPALAAAHFELVYPPSRGTDDENQKEFPCGGYAQTQNRTVISASSFALALDLGHTHSLISVLLALGNDPGSNFNITVQPTVQEQGPGDFCFQAVTLPAGLNIANGTNGTIQVITDGEGGGGLYNCADVTFVTESVGSAPSCSNSTGLTATVASSSALANGTTPGSAPGSSTTAGPTAATTSTQSTTSSPNAAAMATNGAWGVLGAAVLGAAALL